jgi:hypothetical protein
MPLPSPKPGENKDDFISRCMGSDVMLEEYPDEKQRAAVCNNQWRKIEMAEKAEKWFPILKTGTHKDSIGRSWTFGEAELDKLVKNYDPAKFEAPIVIGHPKEEDPAFGWVEELKREGDMLFAKPKQLDEEFRKLVNEGKFKKISAKMTPDLQQLLHVGFFGAYPTSVKSLPTVSLSDQDKDGVEIELSSEWTQRTIADIFRRIREWIIEKFDTETADKVVPNWAVEELIPASESSEAPAFKETKMGDNAPKEGGTNMSVKDTLARIFPKAADKFRDIPDEDLTTDSPMFSEAEVKAQVEKATKEALEKGKTEGKKEADAEFAEQKKELRRAEFETYVDGLIKGDGKKGRALAAAKKEAGLVEFMLHLDDKEAIEFAEGKEKVPMLAQMKAILETLPADITFSEVATKEKDVGTGDAGAKLEKLAREKQAKMAEGGKEISFREALDKVQIENPELAQEYAAELQGQA